ncbi:hypothetical protein T492DRAFT_850871 [Pavlovales sp. CCMP2436]|nr:hypothetical protein T492DRAFT_850871 [Pavlovales sp. CCMP2436]
MSLAGSNGSNTSVGGSDAASILRDGIWTALVSEPLEAGGGVLGGNKNICTVLLRSNCLTIKFSNQETPPPPHKDKKKKPPPPLIKLVRRGASIAPGGGGGVAVVLGGGGVGGISGGGSLPRLGWGEDAGHVLAMWGVSVQRREKDFQRLHEYLSHEVGASTLPKLPSKGGGLLGGGGGGGPAAEIARYRERLQRYLEALLMQPLLANSNAIKAFFTDSNAIKAFFTGTKEEFKQNKPKEPHWAHIAAIIIFAPA